jgi:hypothetical protein
LLDSTRAALDNAGMNYRRIDLRKYPLRRAPRAYRALGVFLWISALVSFAFFVDAAIGADVSPAPRAIERIPRTSKELDLAHETSDYACLQLPAGVALAPARFETETSPGSVKLVGSSLGAAALPVDSGRWPAVSFGVRINKADQADLPRLTGGTILDRVNNYYVCLQVRVERASPAGVPFLHYQPLAAVGEYGQEEKTEKFAALQQTAVANVRSLGLFVKSGGARQPDNLRTMVLSIKGSRVVAGDMSDPPRLEPSLEMIFVRMRVAQAKAGDKAPPAIEIHTFSTTDDLKRLVYVAPYVTPDKLEECGLTSTIRLTEYTFGGQYPSARATRGLKFRSRGEFDLAQLDAYARSAGMKGAALDNLTEVLDAVIDGRLKAP